MPLTQWIISSGVEYTLLVQFRTVTSIIFGLLNYEDFVPDFVREAEEAARATLYDNTVAWIREGGAPMLAHRNCGLVSPGASATSADSESERVTLEMISYIRDRPLSSLS
jgi:hypothetical protein